MQRETGSHSVSSYQRDQPSVPRGPGAARPTPFGLPRSLVSTLVGIALLWSLLGSLNGLGGTDSASAAGDPVIAAAGDIACDPADSHFNGGNGTSDNCQQKATSDMLVNANLDGVLALGDDQYYCGSLTAFNQVYDPTWGRVKSITHPSVGNHEYLTSGGTGCNSGNAGAAGYFSYYGSAAGTPGQGYYSFDVGSWHIIALNSNCTDAGGCGSSSNQYKWLQADLQSHNNYCTLAFWHIPRFSSGGRASSNSQSFWNLLYQYDADVILNGHDHIYERFAPQDPTGSSDPVRGIRQFTVGTGGNNHTSLSTTAANSQVRNSTTFGVLRLTLHATSYDWQFVPGQGKTFTDSGTANCHSSVPAPTATPTSAFTSTPTTGPTATPTATGVPATATPTNTGVPATATPTSTPSQSLTFVPQADSYVSAGSPTTNFGTLTALRADGSPITNSYVRFAVSGLNGASITRARLLFRMNSGSSSTLQAYQVADNSWGETTINYNNAPPLGSSIASTGGLATGVWVTLDVTSYVTGEGTYSFGVGTPGSTAVSFGSRESGTTAPQLILDLAGAPAPTSTPSNTPLPATATPTDTPLAATATPTDTPLPATATPTDTSLAPTSTPTDTPLPPTATPTDTPLPPSATPTDTGSAPTATPTDTPRPPTATPTDTPLPPTATPTDTPLGPTATPTDTPLPPTATPTDTPAPATATPTDTPLPPTATPTDTPAPATATPTDTPLPPTATPTDTPAPATSTPTATPTASAPQPVTFLPNADTYVNSSFPTTNFGTSTQLRVDGSPIVNSYVRFTVTALNGHPIQRVRLLFFMNSSSTSGLQARAVSDTTWSETAMTYNNPPLMGSAIASSGGVTGGTWATIDVTSYVTGEGTYSFGVITPGSTAISFASRESGANAPQLIVDLGP